MLTKYIAVMNYNNSNGMETHFHQYQLYKQPASIQYEDMNVQCSEVVEVSGIPDQSIPLPNNSFNYATNHHETPHFTNGSPPVRSSQILVQENLPIPNNSYNYVANHHETPPSTSGSPPTRNFQKLTRENLQRLPNNPCNYAANHHETPPFTNGSPPARNVQRLTQENLQRRNADDFSHGSSVDRLDRTDSESFNERMIEQAMEIVTVRRRPSNTPGVQDQSSENPGNSSNEMELNNSNEMERRVSDYSFRTVSYTGTSACGGFDDDDGNQVRNENQRPSPLNGTGETQPYENTRSVPSSVQPKQNTKVLITYADAGNDNGQTRRTMTIFHNWLRKNGVHARIDFMEEYVCGISATNWVESQLEECEFVLICITSAYHDVIQEKITDIEAGNLTQTLYIYRQLNHEYQSNWSKNYRFVPILMTDKYGDGKEYHRPKWLRDTKLFRYPADYEDIIRRIYKLPKFEKPKPGPVPVCTVLKYSR